MLNVLYVDDEPINLDLFEVSFMNDFNILKTETGLEALEILKNNPIDVLVTDLKMPGMNGIELIRKVKALDQNKNCILLTGYYEDSIIKDNETKSLIYKYVMKPFKRDELRSFIKQAAE